MHVFYLFMQRLHSGSLNKYVSKARYCSNFYQKKKKDIVPIEFRPYVLRPLTCSKILVRNNSPSVQTLPTLLNHYHDKSPMWNPPTVYLHVYLCKHLTPQIDIHGMLRSETVRDKLIMLLSVFAMHILKVGCILSWMLSLPLSSVSILSIFYFTSLWIFIHLIVSVHVIDMVQIV